MPTPFVLRYLCLLAFCLGAVPLWGQQPGSILQVLSPPPGGAQESAALGFTVALNASYTVAGVPFDDMGGQDSGVVKVFDTATGELLFLLRNPSPAVSDQFGNSVAISGSRVVVGASNDDTDAPNAGIAYVYNLAGSTPTVPVHTLHNPAPAATDQFGFSVAISGQRVAVSANLDDAGATNAGSVYIFNLASSTPELPALTLNNPNPVLSDTFGQSISLDGRHLLVGVPQKDAGGVSNIGAVVLFDLDAAQPATPLATILNPHPAASDAFGNAVSIQGTRFVVGTALDDATGTNSGRAYVYNFSQSVSQVPEFVLDNPSPAPSDNFGNAVALYGTRVIVGALFDDTTATNSGRAYLFDLTASNPDLPSATLAKVLPGATDNLGHAVGIHGDWAAAGVPFDDQVTTNTGSVALFDLSGPTPGTPVRLLHHPSPATGDQFGGAVSLSGTRFVMGASLDDIGALNAGSAYVYDLASPAPDFPIASLHNPNPQNGDEFGRAVALDGNWVAVAAPFADGTGVNDAGRVYVYDLSGANPTVAVFTLENPEPASSDQFGNAMALSGGRLVVGTRLDDALALNSGSAYVYNLEGSTPTVPSLTLRNPTPASQDFFGHAVAISLNQVVISASGDKTGATNAGSAYVYDLSSATPTLPAFTLNNPAPALGDQFGASVSISGALVAVGANLDDAGASDSGSAYIYNLTGAQPTTPAWTLTNPQPAANDQFGFAVSIDGLRVAVSAHFDDRSATDAGTAWVYDLSGATPTTPELFLVAPNAGAGDQFGVALSSSNGRILAGASLSDLVTPDKGAGFVFGAELVPEAVDINVEYPPGFPLINTVATVAFGSTLVGGDTLERSFLVRSRGTQTLTGVAASIIGTNAADFSLQQVPPATLGSGSSAALIVRFSPSAGGPRTAVLRVLSNDPDESPFLITLSGNGLLPTPDIAIEQPVGNSLSSGAAQINYGSVPILTGVGDRTFTLKNTGTAELTNISLSLTGTHANAYQVLVPPAASVASGSSTTFTLRFSPQISGELTAIARVSSNDPDENPFDVFLFGIGMVTPNLALEQPAGTALNPGVSTIAFGTTEVGRETIDRTFTVSNSGTGPLTGLSLNFNGLHPNDFQIPVPLPPSIPAGTEAVFVVRFAPTAGGTRTANLSLGSNNPTHNPFVVGLSGIATVAPDLSIELPPGNPLFSSQSLAEFGNVDLGGQPKDITFTLRNAGTATLTGLTPSFVGGNAADFSVQTAPTATLAPGQTTLLVVRFTPQQPGERFASLLVSSNDPDDNPFEIEMSGFAIPVPDITIEQPAGTALISGTSTVHFGQVNIGLNASERLFALRSTGTGPLAGMTLEIDGTDADDFSIGTFPPNALDPGTQATFLVRFTPAPDKTSHARLRVFSNDPDESPFEIALTGTGVSVPEVQLQQPVGNTLVSGVSAVGFATAAVGETVVDRVFSLQNVGPAELASISIAFAGANASDFTVLTPPAANLAPQGSVTFSVRFSPTAGGHRAATLALTSNDPNNDPFTVDLTGFATVRPDLAVEHPVNTPLIHTQSNVDFGAIALGSGSTQRQFLLHNIGTGTLNSLAVSFLSGQTTDFALVSQPPSILNPGQSALITVSFTPSASGVRQTTLRVASNDPTDSPFSFALTGTGLVEPKIVLEQPAGAALIHGEGSVDFGNALPGGAPSSRVFTLRNTGNGTLSGITPQLIGSHAGDFAIASPLPASLPPGQSTTFTLTFSPGATGNRSASLQIGSNDATANPFAVALTGIGAVVPDIALEQPVGTNLVSGFGFVAFGSTLVRDGWLERSFTVRNTGTATLSGLSLSLTGAGAADFEIRSTPASSIAIGGSTDFVIRFAPKAGGDRAALLNVTSNDPDESPFSLTLTGFGITFPDMIVEHPLAQALTPGVSSIAFGTVILGQESVNRSITLRNPGTGPLLIFGVALSGSAAGDFSVPQPPPASIAPGGSAAFTVRFTPVLNGDRSATIILSSNDAETPAFAIDLNGTGLAQPDITVEHPPGQVLVAGQDTIHCGSVVLGAAPSQRMITMRNTGTAQLSDLGITITGPHAADFSVLSFRDTPLSVAESTPFNIRFQPSAAGARSATLVLSSDDPDENPFEIALTGEGVAQPALVVEGPDTTPLISGSAAMTFGSVYVGAQPGELTITLRNTGTADLTGISTHFTGDNPFDFTANPLPSPLLAPGGSVLLTIRFTPLTLGRRQAQLHISSNAPNINPFVLSLEGSARDYFTEVFSPSRPNDTAEALYTFRPGFALPDVQTNGLPPFESPPHPASGLDIPDAYANAELLASREVPDPIDSTRLSIERLVRTNLKHTLLFVVDQYELSGSKRRRIAQMASVADHIIVKPKPGVLATVLLAEMAIPGAQIRAQLPASDLWLIRLPDPQLDTLPLAIAAALNSGQVDLAEADPVIHAAALPNDPSFASQWSLENTGQNGGTPDVDIDAPAAWDLQTGSSTVVVGVLDTGIDVTHPDLAANLWTNPAEIAGNGIDDDANGYIDDVHGWNFVAGTPNAMDDNAHGTHVAGTLGAVGNNGVGISGVAWQVALMPLKILDAEGTGFTSDAAEALAYSNAKNAALTCNAWGGSGFSQALRHLLSEAGAAGRLFVAAAGNNSRNTDSRPHYPASYDVENIIAVTSINAQGQLSWFANTGVNSVHLAAPGSGILSTIPGGGHALRSGTSAAAAHVAGACVVLKAAHPTWSASNLKSALLGSVKPLASLADRTISGGSLRVGDALQASSRLLVSPAQGIHATGAAGGPFTPSSKEYVLKNLSSAAMSFTATVDKPWVNLSALTGSVPASGSQSLIVSLLPAATALPPGTHVARITFNQTGSPYTFTRSLTLTVSDRYHVTRDPLAVFPTNPAGGQALNLSDDSFVEIPLSGGVAIPFHGLLYSSVYVGSNGYVTFGRGDWRPAGDAEHHFSLQRLSAVSTDLDPSAGGSVTWKQLPDHLAITFENVPVHGRSELNSFQFQLFFTGRLALSIVKAEAPSSVIGISNGLGLPEDYSNSDYSSYPESSEALALFTHHPTSQTLPVGASAQFTGAAIGAPPIAFQWYYNGSPIPGANSNTYLIASANGTSAGEYRLSAINSFGQSFSQIATLTVEKLPATVTLQNLPQVFTGAPIQASAQTLPAGLNVTFTYDGLPWPPAQAGSYQVTAQIDDPIYQGSTTGTLVIQKAPQVIDFPEPPSQPVTGSLNLLATGGPGGLPVTFELTDGPALLTEGNVLTFTGIGPVTVTAAQKGNLNFADAATVTRTFNVVKAPATVSLSNLEQVHTGAARTVTAVTTPPGLTVVILHEGSPTPPTGAGTYAITASINDGTYQGTANGTLTVAQAPQTISFPAIPDQLATASVNLSATGGGSGNAVTFAVTSGPAVITSGNVLTFTGAGSVTITAAQAGGANHLAAQEVQRTFNVGKATATVALSNLTQTFNGTARTVTTTTTPAGLSVTLTYNGSATAPTDAGNYAVSATISDAIYQGIAAGTLIIDKAPQTLSFPAIPDALATASIQLSATGGASGLPVTFAVTNGPATLTSGNVLTFTGAGAVTVTAAQAGNGNYLAAASISRTFNVTKATASITLGSLSQIYNGNARTASATTSPSGLLTQFTYNGSATAPTAAGSYTVVATIDNPLYAGSATATLTIAKANQTLTFPPLSNQLSTATVNLSATGGGSTEPVLFTVTSGPASLSGGSTLTFTGAGSVTLTASQAGDDNHHPATSISRTFDVALANATITLLGLEQTFTGSARTVTATTTPAGLPVTFTYNGSSTAPVNAGSYNVLATLNHPLYQGSTTGTLTVAKAAQSILFGPISDQSTTAFLSLSASGGGSANPVTFAVTSGPATVSGNFLSFSTSGSVTITATQSGNANYHDATPVSQTFTVRKVTVTPNIENLLQTYDGTPRAVTVSPPGLIATITYESSSTPPTNPGSYVVNVTLNDPRFEGSNTGILVISKGTATIALSNLTQTYTGTPRAASAATSPPGLSFTLLYDGNVNSPTSAGDYTVTATINDPLYQGSTSGTLSIAKAAQSIAFPAPPDQSTAQPLTLSATGGGSTSPVIFTVTSGPALLSGSNVLTFTGVGTVTITATQAGDVNHHSATPVVRAFNVSQSQAAIALSYLFQAPDGNPKPVTVTTTPPGISVTVTYNGNPTPPTELGSYTVSAVVSDPLYSGSATATLVIDHRADRDLKTPEQEVALAPAEDTAWTPTAVGLYDGLLRSGSGDPALLGGLESLRISPPKAGSATGGTASGKLRLAGRTINLRGVFDLDGLWTINLPQKDGTLITGALQLQRTTAGHELISGTISWNGVTAVTRLPRAPYHARSNPAPATHSGRFTFVLPSSAGSGINEPGGDGWAAVVISPAGLVRVTGRLADGTPITETAHLSAESDFSLFNELYRTIPQRGHFGGRLAFEDQPGISDFHGTLQWLKRPDTREVRYPSGFASTRMALGSRYTIPSSGTRLLSQLAANDPNASLSLLGPNLPSTTRQEIERVISWQASNALRHFGPETLTGTANRNTGLVSGNYRDPVTGLRIPFQGITFQKQGIAAGQFLLGSGSGALRVQPGTNFSYPGSEDAGAVLRTARPTAPVPASSLTPVPFAASAAGIYKGILTTGGQASGGLENFRVTATGAFTGLLWLQGIRYPLSGTLDANGQVTLTLPVPGIQITLSLHELTDAPGSFELSGSLSVAGANYAVAAQKRALFDTVTRCPHEGSYTLAVLASETTDAAREPAGDGYATLQVSNLGLATGALVLADGTKTTFAGHVSTDCIWSLHRSLYGTTGKGYLAGELVFRSIAGVSSIDGHWTWNKQPEATPASSLYPAGFTSTRPVVGSLYTPPLTGNRAWSTLTNNFYNAWWRVEGPRLPSFPAHQITSLDRVVTWTTANSLFFYGPDQLTLKFNPTNGLVTGTYLDSPRGVRFSFGGILLQSQQLVTGSWLSPAAAGRFSMEARSR